MTGRDKAKLMWAGYRFIRESRHDLKIKVQSEDCPQGWKDLEKGFASYAALRRRMDEILEDHFTLED